GSRTYGAPSVKAAWYGRLSHAGRISRHIFWRVPNVDSALVRLDRHEQPLGTPTERERGCSVGDAALAQRRQPLRAGRSGWAGSASTAEHGPRAAGVVPGARGETVEVEQVGASAAAGAGRAGAVATPSPRPSREPRWPPGSRARHRPATADPPAPLSPPSGTFPSLFPSGPAGWWCALPGS